jgi:hypothetical protein
MDKVFSRIITTFLVLVLIFVGVGTYQYLEMRKAWSLPKQPTYKVIRTREDCQECMGKGKVTYGKDHDIVKLGFDEGTYACPMCGGSGKMISERYIEQ